MSSILDEAARLTALDRQDSYGHPADNHGKTAVMWTAYLADRLSTTLTARDVCIMQILVKVSREAHAPKRDNLVDIAGYARNAEMIEERNAEEREA